MMANVLEMKERIMPAKREVVVTGAQLLAMWMIVVRSLN